MKIRRNKSKDLPALQGGTADTRRDVSAPDVQACIATAAYYRAQERGFEPGREMEDWLAAEADYESRQESPP